MFSERMEVGTSSQLDGGYWWQASTLILLQQPRSMPPRRQASSVYTQLCKKAPASAYRRASRRRVRRHLRPVARGQADEPHALYNLNFTRRRRAGISRGEFFAPNSQIGLPVPWLKLRRAAGEGKTGWTQGRRYRVPTFGIAGSAGKPATSRSG
jgi:hypothetical protein